jgi:hypothetical protein
LKEKKKGSSFLPMNYDCVFPISKRLSTSLFVTINYKKERKKKEWEYFSLSFLTLNAMCTKLIF